MIPFLRNFFKRLLWDEGAFVGWVRLCLLTVAGSGALFAAEIDKAFPGHTTQTKLLALAAFGLSGFLRAGDKTPQEVKDAAKVITSTGYKLPEAP